jgi:predicted ATPase
MAAPGQDGAMRMITQVAISGYRSLRDVRLSLDALNVVTGANGSGKSSLYRALRLLADIAQGRIIRRSPWKAAWRRSCGRGRRRFRAR